MTPHCWDPLTLYCRACGAARRGVVEGERPPDCEGGGNLVAISHRRARQRFVEIGLGILDPRPPVGRPPRAP